MEFVIAAIIAAVLFADWPLDSEALRQRLFTVILAFAVIRFVAAPSLVISPGERDEGVSIGVRDSDEATAAQALVERQVIAAIAAFGLAGAGLVWWFRYRWLATGVHGRIGGVASNRFPEPAEQPVREPRSIGLLTRRRP